MTLRVTTRDIQLIQWINAVGFVTIDHIVLWMDVAKPTAYGRIKKLVQHGYLIHERIFHGALGIYRVSRTGVQLSGSPLPCLRGVPFTSYHHDLQVTTLSLLLVRRLGGDYIPERLLRHETGRNTFGQTGHTPDGVFLQDGKRIAIEVELNKKGKRRREKIFSYYMKAFDYQEVWYFCSTTEIANQIAPFIKNASFIKSYQIQEFMNQGSDDGRSLQVQSG